MAEPLKNIYTKSFFEPIVDCWQTIDPNFNGTLFLERVFNKQWKTMELKERYHHIANCMAVFLPSDFESASEILLTKLEQLKQQGIKVGSYEYLFYPDYIETFGQDNADVAMQAMERMTQFISCEFTVRPFIKKDQDKMMKWLLRLSTHKHQNVRRFSSEGCRPKLPWGGEIKSLIKDPSPILPILQNLNADQSLFVRKSVANNLNDISKDHPDLVLTLCQQWKDKSTETNWIIKHACRTLLKAGNSKAMQLFGYATPELIQLESFQLVTPHVKFGAALTFDFELKNTSKQAEKIRVEYGLYFLKANGQQNRKVFKVSEKTIAANASITISKTHPIKPISTRKYYEGEQLISLIVNGEEIDKRPFLLQF